MRRTRFLLDSLVAATAATLGPVASRALSAETALDRYVAAPDAAYAFTLVKTIEGDRCTGFVLELTSQRWRSRADVDRAEWKHWLTVVQPRTVETPVGALIIGGGSNGDEPPRRIHPLLAFLAVRTGSVVSELSMVPNQPLAFADEKKPRAEDALVAYTWDKYLRTGDETWPLRLPMTKSVVRAMDAVTAFCAQGGVRVDRFVVGGSSKRGWTTWTTAAVDPRVAGVVPIVIDLLNVEAVATHEYRAYGFWSPALRAYEEMGIMRWLGTPQLAALMQIEDPYAYRDRLTMPKLVINATGDEYFVPDSSQWYFDALPREKYLRYVPNTDHALRGAERDAAHSVLAFYQSIIGKTPRPQLSWRFASDGAIHVRTTAAPSHVTLWSAANPQARDFRLAAIGKAFTGRALEIRGAGTYVAPLERPRRGWIASFVELTYPAVGGDTLKLTTDVRVTPNVLPFGPPS